MEKDGEGEAVEKKNKSWKTENENDNENGKGFEKSFQRIKETEKGGATDCEG